LLSFGGVGILSTLSYLFLFILGRPVLGPLASNTLALAFCTLMNTTVHRALSENLHGALPGTIPRPRLFAVATGLFGISLVLTTLSLLAVDTLADPSVRFDLIAVTAANAVAAVLRFSVLRAWVFRPAPPAEIKAINDLAG
jgi:putative flippase GtrA